MFAQFFVGLSQKNPVFEMLSHIWFEIKFWVYFVIHVPLEETDGNNRSAKK